MVRLMFTQPSINHLSFAMRHSALSFSLLALLWFLMVPACKSRYTPATFPDRQLVFGSGGGFAGTVDAYYLLEDGMVFHQAPQDEAPQKLSKLKRAEVQALFEEAESLSLSTREMRRPGNVYAFIEWKEGSQKNRLVWDPDAPKVPRELKRYYQKLMDLSRPAR